MKYKCLIAEDNLLERDMLDVLLGKIDQVEVVASCENGLSAMQYLMANEVDIVFSDVDMPEVSGINLLKSLKRQPVFVFISAHSNYAAEGFDLDVADFIVKPVSVQRLLKAFAKASSLVDRQNASLFQPGIPDAVPFIFARTSDGLQKIGIADITYAESKGNFSLIFLRDGSQHMVLVGLKNLGEQLPEGQFVRIHKNYLVNWTLITLFQKSSISIDGKNVLPVGDAYKKEIARLLASATILERRPGVH